MSKIVEKSTVSVDNIKNTDIEKQNNSKPCEHDFPTKTKNEDENREYGYQQILKDWEKFIECLSKEDEMIFMEMLTNCYNNYHQSINSINNKNNKEKLDSSCLTRTTSLFMALFLYQQKQLNLIKASQSSW